MMPSPKPPQESEPSLWRKSLGVFAYTRRALELVWETSPALTFAFGGLTVLSGLLPASLAWVGKLLIDGVLLAAETGQSEDVHQAVIWLLVEATLIAITAATRRGLQVSESLLQAQLGNRVNVIILEKALTLDLAHFEDSTFYDKMTRARRQASSRPLSLVRRSFRLLQNLLALFSYGALLLQLSWLAVLILAVAALPGFIAETRFASEGFRIFRWSSPARREQGYLEVVVAREDYAKEVQLLGIGPRLVRRYSELFEQVYSEERGLVLRRGAWGFAMGLVATAALYGAYLWVVMETIHGRLTLGEMTMYLAIFKQGQSAITSLLQAVGGLYEDNLYISNLYEYLEQEIQQAPGQALEGERPGDGVRFEGVSFCYPGASEAALRDLSLHIPPGTKLALVGHNGSGKTTLIKLLAGLYPPTEGQILLDGTPVQDWNSAALRSRIGVIFQDFVRYQFSVGENIGVGDAARLEDEAGWESAAEKGMARDFIERLPEGYHTRLGRWFGGRELSIGQWQKIALARAFMREGAQILVLDEPTAAMDAEAEAQIFERFQQMTAEQLAILISHRFSTVRMADHIVVLEKGELVERGNHHSLMELDGRYAQLFRVQAAGYL